MPDWKNRNTQRARNLRNAATPAERHLWQYLSRSELGVKFSRQMPLGPFFADFLCRELKLVVECDGISHDRTPEADASRDAWMAREGYTLLRFTNAEVLGNTEGVLAAIRLQVEQLQSFPPFDRAQDMPAGGTRGIEAKRRWPKGHLGLRSKP